MKTAASFDAENLSHRNLYDEYAEREKMPEERRASGGRERKNMEQKNWFNLTVSPSLYCRYAYIDLGDHLADSLFRRQNISVKFEQEFSNKVSPYRLVICKVLPWYREGFLKALGQLPNKMNLLGFNDYQDFCREYLDDTENWLNGSLQTA